MDEYHDLDGTHGKDVTSTRMDVLDRESLREVLSRDAPNFIELGCGLGVHSMRAALLGATVVAIDQNEATAIHSANSTFPFMAIDCIESDIRDIEYSSLAPIDVVLSQRMLHYIPYAAAEQVLSTIHNNMADDGVAFLSVSGLPSELGDGYPDADVPVQQRHSHLSDEMVDKHAISQPVCLYTEDEFAELLRQAGFEVQRVFLSDFGNVKCVASPNSD